MVTTITVSDETLRRFKSLKSETGDGEAIAELSSDQFMNSLLDAWEENDKSIYGDPEVDLTPVLNRIDDLESNLPAEIRKEIDQVRGR